MLDLQGVKLVKKNISYIKVIKKGFPTPNKKDERSWTIMVKFINESYICIGDYSTQGYAQDRLDEIKFLD